MDRFWAIVRDGESVSREAPDERWLLRPEDAYSPTVGAEDKVYSRRGCFIEELPGESEFEGLDLPAELISALDPMFRLALVVGRDAFRDAVTEDLDRSRVRVILGNIVLPTEGSSALAHETLGRWFEEEVGKALRQEGGRGGAFGPRSGLATHPLNRCVPGLAAGLLAQALGLGGGGYTLDAACASSLYAVKLGVDDLLAGRADAVIAGGLSRPDCLYTQMGFSQLRALSPSGVCSPFDAKGDGLVVGEGAGMFVLKRTRDALRDGDQIYAGIAGVGLSNDIGGSLLAPISEGQLRALRPAYDRAGWSPDLVDLIECHATGTPVGDAVEFESLVALWREAGRDSRAAGGAGCVLGSVKSNVGHLLTGAGAAALMKVVLALRERMLPPTANFERAAGNIGLEGSPFRVAREAEPWEPHDGSTPRRAGVSAFGFGGINAHLLLEEWGDNSAVSSVGTSIVVSSSGRVDAGEDA